MGNDLRLDATGVSFVRKNIDLIRCCFHGFTVRKVRDPEKGFK